MSNDELLSAHSELDRLHAELEACSVQLAGGKVFTLARLRLKRLQGRLKAALDKQMAVVAHLRVLEIAQRERQFMMSHASAVSAG